LSVDFGLLGNLKIHAIKITRKRQNKVTTTATFAFKLTNVHFEDEEEEPDREGL
jgi:hypothetical protein